MSTLFFDEALLPSGWAKNVRLTLQSGMIAKVEVTVQRQSGEEHHAIGLPGMPNLHSHAFQRAMAGLAERRGHAPDSFWTWRELMYQFACRMTPDDVQSIATHLYIEMLEAGFTHVGEFHYLHHDRDGTPYANLAEMAGRIIEAAATADIGLTLLPVFYAHSGFGGQSPHDGQRRFISSIELYGRLIEECRKLAKAPGACVVGIAPHSLRAVTPDELRAILPLAERQPVHIHIAEQQQEVLDCLEWSGRRPVQWLMDHAPVDNRWCLIHATHMTREEASAVADAGSIVGLCPITEANLGDGVFDATAFVEKNGRYGIGSDSNVLISVSGELRQLEYSQRLCRQARNVLGREPNRSTGRTLYDDALKGGAAALGLGKVGLMEGARADLVSLKSEHPILIARSSDSTLDSWVFAERESLIDCVWRGGEKIVTQGRHRLWDVSARNFRRVMEALLQ